jgi:hypothetical protein
VKIEASARSWRAFACRFDADGIEVFRIEAIAQRLDLRAFEPSGRRATEQVALPVR